jgi:hypothetical protein
MRILTVTYGGLGQPGAEELARREAADEWPRVTLYQNQLNSDMLDERDILGLEGARGAVLKRLPMGLAQALEAYSRRKRYGAIVSWGERFGLPLAALLKATRSRTPHIALFSWVSTPKKAAVLRHVHSHIHRLVVWSSVQYDFAVRELGIPPSQPEFAIQAPLAFAVDEAIARAGRPFALLNTGAAWANKRWPAARLAELAVRLRERHGMRSIVLWGPGERALADEVANASSGSAIAAPQTTIADVASLAAAAAVMVSGDTGPTHVASAVGTPLVGIYGPTRPERNGPLGADDETVSRAEVCQCHHLRQCRLPRMCLLDIEVAEVLDAVERRLAAVERHRG